MSENLTPEFTSLFEEYVDSTDNVLIPLSSKWMCSEQCPCGTNALAVYGRMSEQFWNVFDRTKDQSDTNDSDGTVRVVFTSPTGNNETDFFPDTFYDCY